MDDVAMKEHTTTWNDDEETAQCISDGNDVI